MVKSQVVVKRTDTNENHIRTLEQNFLYIGSQGADGIVLQEPRALGDNGRLLIRPSGQEQLEYVLINLSPVTVTYQPYVQPDKEPSRVLGINESVLLKDRDAIGFGSYQLTFLAGDLHFRVEMKETRLTHKSPLTGNVNVMYKSEKTVQPLLEIEGIPKQITPGEQASNPQKPYSIGFQLFHPKGPVPAAGPHRVTFRVKVPGEASDQYEHVEMGRVIQVEPYLEHLLTIRPAIKNTIIGNWLKTIAAKLQ